MNKINIVDEMIEEVNFNDCIEYSVINKSDDFDVNSIIIKVLKNTDLEINHTLNKSSKINIYINLENNVICNLTELRIGDTSKVQIRYVLNDNSILNLNKFYDCDAIREVDIIDLNGYKSLINYNLNTISKNYEKYNLIINHNNNDTISNINNKGINIENGKLIFNVTSSVGKNIINCKVDQNNRIINFSNNECIIKPILLIDNNDIDANHSAYIGKFNYNDLFYLMSRGINKEKAYNLLVKGFLLGTNKNDIYLERIDKYWR